MLRCKPLPEKKPFQKALSFTLQESAALTATHQKDTQSQASAINAAQCTQEKEAVNRIHKEHYKMFKKYEMRKEKE